MSPWILHASTFFFSALKENRVKLIYFSWYNIHQKLANKEKMQHFRCPIKAQLFQFKGARTVSKIEIRPGTKEW